MPAEDQEILRTYLQRVMELSEERSVGPTDDELKAIAREVGISEADLEFAEQSAEDHRLRGVGFLEHGRYGDAIGEFSEAAALAPGRLDIKHDLARSHAGRFRRHGHEEDRRRAEILARRHLELDPRHQGSFLLLNELDLGASPAAIGEGRRKKPPLPLAVVALAGFLVLAGVVLFRSSEPEPFSPPVTDPPEGSVAEAPAVNAPQLNAPQSNAGSVGTSAAKTPSSPSPAAAEVDIPMDLVTELDLGFDVRLSRLNTYVTGKSFFTLNAVIENRGDTELEKVSARLDLQSGAGQSLATKTLEMISGPTPPLRPGDAHAIHQLLEVQDPEIRSARLIVERVDQTPAAADYGVASPVKVEWPEGQPGGFSIAVRERSQRFSENAFGQQGEGYFEAILEIENTSARTIRGLKLRTTVIWGDGGWATEIDRFVVVTRGADFRAGEERVVRFLNKVEGKPEGYEVSVLEIR